MNMHPRRLRAAAKPWNSGPPTRRPKLASGSIAWMVAALLLGTAGIGVADLLPLPSDQNPMPPIDYLNYPHLTNLNDTGRVWQVASRNGVLYAAADDGLQVWDYRDPEAPTRTGTLTPGRLFYTVRVQGDRAYATDSIGRFHIYDLASGAPLPVQLCDVALLPALGSTHDIAFSGSIVYVVENSGGIYVIDCANPRLPSLRGHYPVSGLHHDAMATEGSVAALCQGGDLYLVDISRPSYPVIGPCIATPGNTNSVVLRNGIAYVADYHHGFFIMDVRDPAHPVEISRFERAGFYSRSLVLEGNLVISGNSWDGVVIVDVSKLSQPRLVTAFGCGLSPLDMIMMGDQLVTGGERGLHTFALANHLGIPRLTAGPSRPDPRDFVIGDQRAFVAGWRGIHEFDLSRDGPPVLRDSISTAQDLTWGLAIKDQYLYATVDRQGLLVYRLSLHERPALVGSLPLGGRYVFQDLAISGNVAVVAAWSWVIFVDVSDPTHPRLLSGLDLQQVTTGVELNGNLAYVAAGYGGLVVIDFTNPGSPTVISTDVTGDRTGGVAWRAPYLYVGSKDGFRIYDGSDPRQPRRLGYLSLPTECGQPVLKGRVAYVPSTRQGLQLISVADPANPKLLGGYDPLNWQCFAAIANDQVYVAGGDSLYVFPLHRGRGVSSTPPRLAAIPGTDNLELSWQIPSGDEPERFRVLAFAPGSVREIPFEVLGSADQRTAKAFDHGSGASLPSSYVLQARSDEDEWLDIDRVEVGGLPQPTPALAVSISPNPANPRKQITLDVRDGGSARVEIFDLSGRRVKRLLDGPLPAGRTRVDWDGVDDRGRTVASGMYLCRGVVAGATATTRLQLVR